MAFPWFRFYTEWADDPKVQMLPEPLQRRLAMLFCFQAQGWLDTATDDHLSFKLRISLDEVEKTRSSFEKQGFISPGSWQLTNWEKRQKPSDKSTPRVQKHRMKQNETVSETVCNESMKQSETVQRRGEERRIEEIRIEERRKESANQKPRGSADLVSLNSFIQKVLPTPPLPQTLSAAMAQGYTFSNSRPCRVCGAESEWWNSPGGSPTPFLTSTGELHLGGCAQRAKETA